MAKFIVRYVTFALAIVCLATISKSEYEWTGKEWIWKESSAESNVDASGDEISALNDDEYDAVDYNGSGDGSLSDGEDLGIIITSGDIEKEFNFLFLHISTYFEASLYITFFTEDVFFFGNQGQHDCPRGAFIRDQAMCKKACTQLGLPLREILGGFVCYKDYRGFCYQNGQNGGGASMVCKNPSK